MSRASIREPGNPFQFEIDETGGTVDHESHGHVAFSAVCFPPRADETTIHRIQIRSTNVEFFTAPGMTKPRLRLSEQLAAEDLTSLREHDLETSGAYENVITRGASLRESRLANLALENSLFTDVDLSGSRWTALDCVRVVFDHCQLANAAWADWRMERGEIQQSGLTGFQVPRARIRNLLCTRSKLNLSVFHDAQLSQCRFEKCDFREADFQGADLRQVVFRDCDLRQARFAGALLSELDLRGSHLQGIAATGDALRGDLDRTDPGG